MLVVKRSRHALTRGALSLVTALGCVLPLALPAHADPVKPTIEWAGGTIDDPGIVQAGVRSDSDVTSVTGEVLDPAHPDDPPLATLAGGHVTSGTAAAGTWTFDRVVLPHLGAFTLRLEATDADGDLAATDATLSYRTGVRLSGSVITPAPDPGQHLVQLGHANPVMTVTGTLTRVDPTTGDEAGPWSGMAVQLIPIASEGNGPTAVTSPDGTFTASWSPGDPTITHGAMYLSVTPADPDDRSGGLIAMPDWTVSRTPARIRLDHPGVTVRQGQKVTVAGVLEYLDGTAAHPVSGASVLVDPQGTAVRTDINGRFSWSTTVSQPGGFTVSFAPSWKQDDPGRWFTAPSVTAAVTVIPRGLLAWNDGTFDATYGTLRLQGWLAALGDTSRHPKAGTHVYLLQSPNGRDHWTNLGWIPTKADGSFDYWATISHPKGCWKLRFYGTSTLQAADSAKFCHSRVDTDLSANAGPEPVRKGRTITVAGTLRQLSGSRWVPFTHQRVTVYFKSTGARTWTPLLTTRTDSYGHYTAGVRATRDGAYSAVWWTTRPSHWVSAFSPADAVDVR